MLDDCMARYSKSSAVTARHRLLIERGARFFASSRVSSSLPLLAGSKVDGFLTVTDQEAMEAARNLARREGIFAGFSSGANLAAAIKLLQGPERGGIIAILICDTGLKYLSTGLWTSD